MIEKELYECDNFKQLATDFRAAIEKCIEGSGCARLRKFPRGCCRQATWLLGNYLVHVGNVRSEKLFVSCTDLQKPDDLQKRTHMWLEYGDLIIDISADQFPEKSQEPIIITSNHDWHCSKFTSQKLIRFDEFKEDFRKDDLRDMSLLYEDISDFLTNSLKK